MPIHPHECVKCNHAFEVVTLSIKAVPDPTCPKCKAKAERRYGTVCIKTDSFNGDIQGGNQFAGNAKQRAAARKAAKKAGISVAGHVYQNGLARFPQDPEAWVRDKADVKKVLEKRGWGSEELGVKARQVEPAAATAISEDLVNAELQDRVAAGTIDPKEVEKHRDAVRDIITPHYAKAGAKSRPIKRTRPRKS